MSLENISVFDEKIAEISFTLMDADKLMLSNIKNFSDEKKQECFRINAVLDSNLRLLYRRIINDEEIEINELEFIEKEIISFQKFLNCD